MRRIEDNKDYEKIWNDFQQHFHFEQNFWFVKKFEQIFDLNRKDCKIFMIDDNNKIVFEDKYQSAINKVLKSVIKENMYAIDWQHEIFEFNPNEDVAYSQTLFENDDFDGFPAYYPNGDDYFFVTKDFSQGILCVPGFGYTYPLMFVIGKNLIKAFDNAKTNLPLKDFDKKSMDEYEDMLAYKNVDKYAEELKKYQPNASKEQRLQMAQDAINDAKRRNKNKDKNRIVIS